MLKTFGLATAALLFLTTADTSLAAPMAGAAGFGHHGGMIGGPGRLPGFGHHPGHGFDHGDRDFHHDHDFHHGGHNRLPVWWGGWGWPYWWGDDYDRGEAYPAQAETGYPPPPPEVSKPPAPPPCPEMLHWDPKLGHATREKLCDQ
jgi:hypothetical protein